MSIEPDTKDWTWVLERPCPECGFDAATVTHSSVASRILENAEQWLYVVRWREVAERPDPTTWSPLEYACHVRDVHRTMHGRVALMLHEDRPTFPNWDQDATAIADDYGSQDPWIVGDELARAARVAAQRYDRVYGDQWKREGLRSNGSEFTVDSISRYHLHDVEHHLWDVTRP